MTPPNGAARSDTAASGAVGCTYPPTSLRRQESTLPGPHPGIAPGAGSGADCSSASTASPDLVTVAALYVERGGVYFDLPAIDPWDETRDARNYAGPHPVVAHPPCGRWCQLAGLVEHVHGLKAGEDGGCFEHALWAVRTFGGVLEHPAETRAWRAFGLPKPATKGGWTVTLDGECVCYVEQEAFGHPGRKPTWLYAYGVELPQLPWQSRAVRPDDAGWYVDKRRGQVKHGQKRLRDGRGSRTPIAFRDALLAIARTSTVAQTPRLEVATDARD